MNFISHFKVQGDPTSSVYETVMANCSKCWSYCTKCRPHHENDVHTMRNVGRNTLNVCQGPKGGLEEPPRAPGDPPLPLYLKKL